MWFNGHSSSIRLQLTLLIAKYDSHRDSELSYKTIVFSFVRNAFWKTHKVINQRGPWEIRPVCKSAKRALSWSRNAVTRKQIYDDGEPDGCKFLNPFRLQCERIRKTVFGRTVSVRVCGGCRSLRRYTQRRLRPDIQHLRTERRQRVG